MTVRIVIADDHALFRQGLERLLNGTPDMDVVASVADGLGALSAVAEQDPDVLLLDISMPGLSGHEVAKRLHGALVAPKIIYLTMHEDATAFLPAISQGIVHGYVLKSNAFGELAEAVRLVMRGGTHVSREALANMDGKFEERLTPREHEVLALTAKGKTARSVARELGISVKTVENHRAHVLEKLGAANMAEAVAQSAKKGLLQ